MKRIRLAALKLLIRYQTARLETADINYILAVFDHNHSAQPYTGIAKAAKRYARIKEKIRRLEVRCEAIRRTF